MKFKKIVIALLLIGLISAVPGYRQIVETAARIQAPMTLVIDAGHGGPDSGASAADGTGEQQINLAVAQALKKEAEQYGVRVVMTRTSEEGLYENGEQGGAWSKLGDMKERRRIIDEAKPDLTVSIHLNSFLADTSVHGAQVFYPKGAAEEQGEDNKLLAEEIQSALKAELADGANRIVLPKDGIYLFRRADHPMILVECGFLSNPGDLENLKSRKYQQRIADAVMKAVAQHYGLEVPKTRKMYVIDSRTDR